VSAKRERRDAEESAWNILALRNTATLGCLFAGWEYYCYF